MLFAALVFERSSPSAARAIFASSRGRDARPHRERRGCVSADQHARRPALSHIGPEPMFPPAYVASLSAAQFGTSRLGIYPPGPGVTPSREIRVAQLLFVPRAHNVVMPARPNPRPARTHRRHDPAGQRAHGTPRTPIPGE